MDEVGAEVGSELSPEEFVAKRLARTKKETLPEIDGSVELHAVDGLDPYRPGAVFDIQYSEEDNKLAIVAGDSHSNTHGISIDKVTEQVPELEKDKPITIKINGKDVEVKGRYEVATTDVSLTLILSSDQELNPDDFRRFEYAYFKTLLNGLGLAEGQNRTEARHRDYFFKTSYIDANGYRLKPGSIRGSEFLDDNNKVESQNASKNLYDHINSRRLGFPNGPKV